MQAHPDCLIHELFEKTCDRIPDAFAVETADESLTYSQLNIRANKLAAKLRHLVCLCMISFCGKDIFFSLILLLKTEHWPR